MLNDGVEGQPTLEVTIQAEDLELSDFEEVQEAMECLKNNKAPEADGLPSELFRYVGQEAVKALYNIIMDAWISEGIPVKWYKTIICPIHKKGNILDSSNYWGISLLSRILFLRLLPHTVREIGKYQAGFMRGKGTTDQTSEAFENLQAAASKMGLKFNQSKIKYMVMNPLGMLPSHVLLNGYTFERVEEYKFLYI